MPFCKEMQWFNVKSFVDSGNVVNFKTCEEVCQHGVVSYIVVVSYLPYKATYIHNI